MMNTLKNENKDYSNDVFCHLEQLETDLYRMQIGNNRNFILSKSIDILIEKIEMIKRIVQVEIRFDWLKIQAEMDRLYKEDNSLTGFNILFDFKESEKSNRALIHVNKIQKDEKGK